MLVLKVSIRVRERESTTIRKWVGMVLEWRILYLAIIIRAEIQIVREVRVAFINEEENKGEKEKIDGHIGYKSGKE